MKYNPNAYKGEMEVMKVVKGKAKANQIPKVYAVEKKLQQLVKGKKGGYKKCPKCNKIIKQAKMVMHRCGATY